VQCPAKYIYSSDKTRDLILKIICVLSSAGRVTSRSDHIYRIRTVTVEMTLPVVNIGINITFDK